jgi:hypothetical protein
MRGAKNDQNLVSRCNVLPNRICARDVRMKDAELFLFAAQLERDVIGIEAALSVRNQDAEGILFDELVQKLGARLGKVRRNVHLRPFMISATPAGLPVPVRRHSRHRQASTEVTN